MNKRTLNGQQLPADPEGMNNERAQAAKAAVVYFQEDTGAEDAHALCDLFADLMHYCDREGIDFALQLERAQCHYDAETTS